MKCTIEQENNKLIRKSFFISLLLVMTFTLSACDESGGKATSDSNETTSSNAVTDVDLNKLWKMLAGYWTTSLPEALNVFYCFDYNEVQKPIFYVVWYYERDETQYATHIEKISGTRYKVTTDVPPNKEEGLHEMHDGYTNTMDIDISRISDNEITIISSSGTSSVWKLNSKTADGRTFDTFKELQMDIKAADLPKVKGKVVKAVRYEDNSGQNLILLTETDVVEKPCPDCPMFPPRSKELYAYCFSFDPRELVFKQEWLVTDFVRDCNLNTMSVAFILDAFRITDLNADGKAEIWMTYILECSGDPSPKTMKIIMYEGNLKYAVRGKTRALVGDFGNPQKNVYDGGEYELDPVLKTAPVEYVKFAKELWEQYKNQ